MILIPEIHPFQSGLEHQIWDLELKLKEINVLKILQFQIEFLNIMSLMLWLWKNQLKNKLNWERLWKNNKLFPMNI